MCSSRCTQADRDGSGRLEPREVAVLLRRLVPETRPEDLRTAVAVMFRNMVRARPLAPALFARIATAFSYPHEHRRQSYGTQFLFGCGLCLRPVPVPVQDHDGDGTLSFQEFMYALRAVDLQTPDRTLRAGSWQVARAGAYPASRCVVSLQIVCNPTLQSATPSHLPYHYTSWRYAHPDLEVFHLKSVRL